MNAAREARGHSAPRRLLTIDPLTNQFEERMIAELASLLREGDLLVANDAATLPASLTTSDGALELRLASRLDDGSFRALAFGAGDWRMRTEDRPAPPPLREGTRLRFRHGLAARVLAIEVDSGRLVRVRFEADEDRLWPALYRAARPVQYSYLRERLSLWDVQTVYGARPWAFEPPSAGLPLHWALLMRLRERGVSLATLTHAAGLSSTGDAQLDALLPLDERFDLPASTVRVVAETRARGGRIVAAGTTVVRALEGCAVQHGGELMPGEGWTNLRLGPGFRPRVVDGLLSGVHTVSESHYRLLEAFASRELLDRAHAFAERAGFLGHEFGDATLILPSTGSGPSTSSG